MIPYNLPVQFVCWRLQGKKKLPCNANGRIIDAHDPINWMTAEQAAATDYGVAYVLTEDDGWFFLDLDKCFVNGQWTAEATAIFQAFPGAWGEVSQSGTGLHIMGRCTASQLQDRRNKWDGWKEFYFRERFIAFGGHGWARIGGVDQDYDWTDMLLRIVPQREFLGELPEGRDPIWNGPEDDDELIMMMKRSKSAASSFGDKAAFIDLWTGNVEKLKAIYPNYDGKDDDFDHSSADMALMSHLAFWTGKDMPRMDRLFRRSALMREKYAEREDYRSDTIQKAARLASNVYHRDETQKKSREPVGLGSTSFSPVPSSLNSVDEIAKEFVRVYGECWTHNHSTGVEFRFDGRVWRPCKKQELLQAVREFVCSRVAADRVPKHKPSHWEEVRRAIVIDPAIAKSAKDFDADVNLVNLPSGTLDLRTGDERRHQSRDLITQITGADPKPYLASRFARFVHEVCGEDTELAKFIQIAFGSCLGGLHDDHWFMFIYGQGRNGKSLLIEVICAALGDYALSIPSAALMSTKNPINKDVFAQLAGKRLVVSSEVESGAHFDEPLLKQLTGDEMLSVRPLYKDTFNIRRSFKLCLVGNHKPQIRTDDAAIRSRLKLCEFSQDFSGERGDPHLRTTLFSELGAVMQWLIDGQVLARSQGRLINCPHVEQEVSNYFSSQGTVESWISERTLKVQDDGRARSQWHKSSDLYLDYKNWAHENGIERMSQVRWSEAMVRNGFKRETSNGTRYVGIELITGLGRPHLRAV